MKQKKNNATLKKTLGGLLIILMVMGAVTLARYTTSLTGTGTATTALYQNDAEFTLTNDDMPMHPGDQRIVAFSVTNTKDAKTAEVAQLYEFTVETAENIPLKFAFSKDGGTTWNNAAANTETNYQSVLGLNAQTDNWKIRIIWPDAADDSKYANEIDYVRIKIHMEQKAS